MREIPRPARPGSAIALLLLALAAMPSAAQERAVHAWVEPADGITDTTPFQLTVQIDGAGAPEVRPPQLPRIPGVSVLGGPAQSSNFVFRNGRASANVRWIWTLLANEPGEVEIPSLRVEVDGKSYATRPLRLVVRKAAASGATPPGDARRGRAPASPSTCFSRPSWAPNRSGWGRPFR